MEWIAIAKYHNNQMEFDIEADTPAEALEEAVAGANDIFKYEPKTASQGDVPPVVSVKPNRQAKPKATVIPPAAT